ncbi:MAG: flagellar basal body P-ring protein FlgI [Fimbriimonadaceae bacterium]|nr:flagellar basal body P-ring protein FlgI [Fimbriimonadaceae bacterium]
MKTTLNLREDSGTVLRVAAVLFLIGLFLSSSLAQSGTGGTGGTGQTTDPEALKKQQAEAQIRLRKDLATKQQRIIDGEQLGVEVRLKDIAHFRGIRAQQLKGVGLVTGLAGTGDSKKSAITRELFANYFKDLGIKIDAADVDAKNVAAVMITAELPPFSASGQYIDINVEAIGDAKSLVGGTLAQSFMYLVGDKETVYAAAQGQITVGGYDVSGGGSSSSKGHVTAGTIPSGAIVEKSLPAKFVFESRMYLDMDDPDITTASRIAAKLNELFPQYLAHADNSGTISMTLPTSESPITAMSQIELVKVMSDGQATIVVDEKTGTIVFGANVKIGPAAIAQGSLNVKIDTVFDVSQPLPKSNGQTVIVPTSTITVDEANAQVATLAPNTTVQDLAKMFQALQLKPKDIISILRALRTQGALKARIISQ